MMRPRGAVAVEFAIVGLAFVSLLLVAAEAGWQMVIESALGAGARAASRFGTTGATVPFGMTPAPASRTDALVQLVIQNSGGLLLASRLTIGEVSYASFTALAAGTGGVSGPGAAGQVVRYTFSYTQPYLTPMAMTITGAQQLLHSVTVTVVNEPFPAT
jgi:hypothetical protein